MKKLTEEEIRSALRKYPYTINAPINILVDFSKRMLDEAGATKNSFIFKISKDLVRNHNGDINVISNSSIRRDEETLISVDIKIGAEVAKEVNKSLKESTICSTSPPWDTSTDSGSTKLSALDS